MSNIAIAERGRMAVYEELLRRGAVDLRESKDGTRHMISFSSKNGRRYKVSTRAKTAGTWQTSIDYGRPGALDPSGAHYWVFVDLGCQPHRFYPVPETWIANDIYERHQRYLARHGGRRKGNDDSKHHAIELRRIEQWHDQWSGLGL